MKTIKANSVVIELHVKWIDEGLLLFSDCGLRVLLDLFAQLLGLSDVSRQCGWSLEAHVTFLFHRIRQNMALKREEAVEKSNLRRSTLAVADVVNDEYAKYCLPESTRPSFIVCVGYHDAGGLRTVWYSKHVAFDRALTGESMPLMCAQDNTFIRCSSWVRGQVNGSFSSVLPSASGASDCGLSAYTLSVIFTHAKHVDMCCSDDIIYSIDQWTEGSI